MKKLIQTSLFAGLFGAAVAVNAFAHNGIIHNATSTDTSMATTTATSTATTTSTTTQAICVTNAVEKREDSIIAAHDAFNASIKNALIARKAGLKAALALTDVNAREVARKSTQNIFASSSKAAEKSLKLAKETGQSIFKSELRSCGLATNFKATSAATSTKNRGDDNGNKNNHEGEHDNRIREAKNQEKSLKKFLLSKEYKRFEKYFMNF